GRDPQRLPERRLRLGLAAGGQADAAQAAPGLGFARLQLGGLAVGGDGLVEVPAGVLLVADLAIGIAIARAQRQRAPQVFQRQVGAAIAAVDAGDADVRVGGEDRKSTRLNSSHVKISYAVFCLKKKMEKQSEQ